MKITNKLEAEILHVMEDYWSSYLSGDLATWASYLPDNYKNIGTTKAEIWNSKKEIVDFTESVLDQTVGMAEIRNKKTQIIPFEPYIMVHELGDLYIKAEEGWVFYATFRLSSLLDKAADGWKILHQHGSYPDAKADEGEAFAFDEIKAENKKLRDVIKSRTIELEQKNRELEIESALERIRSMTMAMQNSDELGATSFQLFKELKALGEISDQISIGIFDEKNQVLNLYATLHGEQWKEVAKIDLEEPVVMQKIYAGWQQDKKSIQIDLSGDELKAYNSFRNKFSDLDYEDERWVIHCAFFSKGVLTFSTTRPHHEPTMQLLERFAQVFDGTYTRFLDLQKAEAQVREAQIEAALERVRAQTMAMHSSEDVGKCIVKMFGELTALGVSETTRCGIGIFNHDNENMELWTASKDDRDEVNMNIGNLDMATHPLLTSARNAWKDKKITNLYILEGADLLVYYKTINAAPGYSVNINIDNLPERIFHYDFVFDQGILYAFSHDVIPDEITSIFRRFTALFEQTYRRYLDLVNAEANAREARIELALERVRARAMAMRQTDELKELIGTVYNELKKLDISLDRCLIWIINSADYSTRLWLANAGSQPVSFYVPHHTNPPYLAFIKGWKERNTKWQYDLGGREKKEWDAFVFHHTDMQHLPEPIKKGMQASKSTILGGVFYNFGCLQTAGPIPMTDEQYDILNRFANVFEQTYTRFLDLQKAEAQAREAQIEAALERVRANTMAMHQSSELPETAQVMFEQFVSLGSEPWVFAFCIFRDGQHLADNWACSRVGPMSPMALPHNKDSVFINIYDAWKEDKPMHIEEVSGDRLVDHFEYVKGIQSIGKSIDEMSDHGISLPAHIFFNCANFKYGYIMFGTYDNQEEDHDIFLRFAKVFEQTYTRFLDLKSAEQRAQEAEVEASLERIRSRAMAMHRTDELNEVVGVIFEELKNMGFDNTLCSIGIYDEETKGSDWWSYIANHELPGSYHFPYLHGRWFREIYDVWATQKAYHYIEMLGEERDEQTRLSLEQTDWKYLPEEVKSSLIDAAKDGIRASYVSMTRGVLEIVTQSPLDEEQIQLLQRFTKVIDLTYTRVDDLQQAEARAREAERQASLDRIRGEIASMRDTDDLLRITPLMWKELILLEIPFFRCGVFIMNEEKEEVNAFLTNPQGEALTSLVLPFDAAENIVQIVKHWKKEEVYSDSWDQKGYRRFYETLSQKGLVNQSGLTDNVPQRLHLQFFPFSQGMLYLGSESVLSEDHTAMMKRMAVTFQTAYTRYEDFRLVEDAKRKAEGALNDLKATQAQLIQSEKMASLGELTAGIAHEIQNPLNFVNNFSDVSSEMIDEAFEELENQDLEEAKEILKELKGNLEKIQRHGERASSIVKGMLEHSRESSTEKTSIDINALSDEYLRLAYHGLRAKDRTFNASYESDFDDNLPSVRAVSQDIGRVLHNLISNAFQAVDEKSKSGLDGYAPKVSVSTAFEGDHVVIRVKDNGPGIPEDIKNKIFQPFFTTKPTGQGTGLGLSLAYDIIKAHHGEITVESKAGEGSTFTVIIPITP